MRAHRNEKSGIATWPTSLRVSGALFMIPATTLMLFFLVTVTDAFASNHGGQADKGVERLGQNIGEMLGNIGGWLVVAVVGFAGLALIPGRGVTKLPALLLLGFVVGGMFLAPGVISDLIEGTWETAGKGV